MQNGPFRVAPLCPPAFLQAMKAIMEFQRSDSDGDGLMDKEEFKALLTGDTRCRILCRRHGAWRGGSLRETCPVHGAGR